MSWKYYPLGKDQVFSAGLEIDEESFHTTDEILIALIKALINNSVITKHQLLTEL